VIELAVVRRRLIAEDIVELTMRRPDEQLLPAWSPGAHIDVQVAPDVVRQYSLCGKLGDRRHYRIAVLRERQGRGGSTAVHENLRSGSLVRVGMPRNNFALDRAPAYLFIAGGIGITPIIPMIEQIRSSGACWRLLFGGRRRASMAYVAELERLREVSICPQDRTGLLDLPAEIGRCTSDELIYCCGPEPLLAAVEDRCAQSGRPQALRVERFQPRPTGPVVDDEFVVELGSSEQELTVPPDRSILEVLREAGLDVLSSCEEGTCGSCETAVLSGIPEHRDSVLSDEEQAAGDRMMVCVSRSRSFRLRLDVEPVGSLAARATASKNPESRTRLCG
jgi:ferredoxin-NADP reductase